MIAHNFQKSLSSRMRFSKHFMQYSYSINISWNAHFLIFVELGGGSSRIFGLGYLSHIAKWDGGTKMIFRPTSDFSLIWTFGMIAHNFGVRQRSLSFSKHFMQYCSINISWNAYFLIIFELGGGSLVILDLGKFLIIAKSDGGHFLIIFRSGGVFFFSATPERGKKTNAH